MKRLIFAKEGESYPEGRMCKLLLESWSRENSTDRWGQDRNVEFVHTGVAGPAWPSLEEDAGISRDTGKLDGNS